MFIITEEIFLSENQLFILGANRLLGTRNMAKYDSMKVNNMQNVNNIYFSRCDPLFDLSVVTVPFFDDILLRFVMYSTAPVREIAHKR
jgi:hypothetical protein